MNLEGVKGRLTLTEIVVIAVHAVIGWALCGAIIGVGTQFWTMDTTLIVHAFGVPIVFLCVSLSYYTFFNYTTPLQTATIFVASAILLDLVVVAVMIERSFEMFGSLIGTWIPWALIFTTTYLVGEFVTNRSIKQTT